MNGDSENCGRGDGSVFDVVDRVALFQNC